MSLLQGQGQIWDLQPWQKAIDQLDGSEQEGSVIPAWLSNILFSERIPFVKESKAGFHLLPAQVTLVPLGFPQLTFTPSGLTCFGSLQDVC